MPSDTPRRPPGVDRDRITRTEVVADTLKSDIRELKQKLDNLDDEVNGLTLSQHLQLVELDNIRKSLGGLETTIRAMTTTVSRVETARELDFDLSKAASGITIKKIQSYFAIGVTLAGILWAMFGFFQHATKPDTHLIDAIHQNQLENAVKK